MAFQTINSQEELLNTSIDSIITIPAGHFIDAIIIENTSGNNVTGGVRIGTTENGNDVVNNIAVGASTLFAIATNSINKRIFSLTENTTLYINTATSWNSSNVNFKFVLRRVI